MKRYPNIISRKKKQDCKKVTRISKDLTTLYALNFSRHKTSSRSRNPNKQRCFSEATSKDVIGPRVSGACTEHVYFLTMVKKKKDEKDKNSALKKPV